MRVILVGIFVWLWTQSALSNGILDRAYEQYSQRDFTPEGIKSAVNAHYNYDRMKMRLGDVMGERVVIRISERRISVPLRDGIDQACWKCGTHSELRMVN